MKTKICILVLVAICIQPFILRAQDDDEKLYKGIRFGYQNSQLSESDWGELSSFYVGIFGAKKIGVSKLLSIYTGLEYYETGTYHDADNQVKISYLSLPINLRVKLGPMYGFGGVNPSFKIGEDAKLLGVDVSDQTKISGFDMGAQLGIGAKLAFIGIEVKYNLGFIDISDGNKTSHLQAGLCVYF